MIFVSRPRRKGNMLAASALMLTLSAPAVPLLAAPAKSSGVLPPPPTSPEQKSLLLDMQDAFAKIAKTVEPSVVNIKVERFRNVDASDFGLAPDQTPGDGPDAPDQPETPVKPPTKDAPKNGTPPKAPAKPKPGTPLKGDVAPAPPSADAPSIKAPTPRTQRRSEATGSGVIVSSDGYILTNDHVVDGAANGIVTVTLSDGRQFKGKVYPDYRSDLAVVKIDPGSAKLPAAQFADSSKVVPGQWAIAVGSPFNLENTMTVGVISALGRHQRIPGETAGSGRYYPDLLQTDAAINPGNSGGPLFNIDGKVIGINVAIESPVEASSGVGFAIPSVTAQSIMNALITKGKVTRGYLGIAPDDLTPALQQEFSQPAGAFVRDVRVDSPAGKAGIQAADIITYFNGEPVTGEVSLRQAIADTEPGKSVKVAYVRSGTPFATSVTLITAPPVPGEDPGPSDVTNPTRSKLGLGIRDITPHDRQEMSIPTSIQGVTVVSVEPNSPAEAASYAAGMPLVGTVIQRLGKTVVKNKKDFDQALAAIGEADSFTASVVYSAGGDLHQTAITITR
ncbi:MAG: trypsin-like peptidase domain-containing protein [Capsulimonas sp.]|uniref:trypsin-like peptidase domain-containing protein n=1 Tax=Capsulimonas sp. TaxID=2494211 RepID=UPI0032644C3D